MTDGDPRAAGATVGQTARKGVVALMTAAVSSRGLTLLAHWALGWLLDATAFAAYASALAIVAVARTVQESLPREMALRIKAQRPSETQGLVAATGLISAGTVASYWLVTGWASSGLESWSSPAEVGYVIVLILGIAVGAGWPVVAARLSLQGRFGVEARWVVAASVAQHVTAVSAAFILRSGLALAFGVLASHATFGIAARYQRRRSIAAKHAAAAAASYARSSSVRRFWQSKDFWWLLGASGGFAIFTTGDYLALSAVASPAVLGVYYFGFQLFAQVISLVGTNMHRVLYPSLIQMSTDRRKQVISSVLSAQYFWATFLGCIGLPWVQPGLQLLWQDRWLEAGPVIQTLLVTLAFRLTFSIVKSADYAHGFVRRWTITVTACGIAVAMAAGVAAAFSGNVVAITASVSSVFVLSTGLMIADRIRAGVFPPGSVRICFGSAFVGAVAAGPSILGSLIQDGIVSLVTPVLSLAALVLLFRVPGMRPFARSVTELFPRRLTNPLLRRAR